MKLFQLSLCLAVFACLLAGCERQAAEKSNSAAKSGEQKKSGADQKVDDNKQSTDHTTEGHAHGTGPHGGSVADWGGGKFHVEFTVDHDKQEATVYVFGADEKTPVAIDASEITLAIIDPKFNTALKPSPQEGDADGKASRFIGNHESLGVVQEYEGALSGTVDDVPYSGKFKEEPDDS